MKFFHPWLRAMLLATVLCGNPAGAAQGSSRSAAGNTVLWEGSAAGFKLTAAGLPVLPVEQAVVRVTAAATPSSNRHEIVWEKGSSVALGAKAVTRKATVNTPHGKVTVKSSFRLEKIPEALVVHETRAITPDTNLERVRLELPFFVPAPPDASFTIPAAWYGANIADPSDIIPYPRGFHTPWSIRLDAAATPGCAIASSGAGFALALHEGRPSFARHEAGATASLCFEKTGRGYECSFSYPSLQYPHAFRKRAEFLKKPHPPEAYFMDIRAGETVTFELRHYLPRNSKQRAEHLLCRQEHRLAVAAGKKKSPWFSTRETIVRGLEAVEQYHWAEGIGYTHHGRTGDDPKAKIEFHIGWCGGTVATYAAEKLKELGDIPGLTGDMRERLTTRERIQNRFILENAASPCGLANGVYYGTQAGGQWLPLMGWATAVDYRTEIHIRNPLEACLFLALALQTADERRPDHDQSLAFLRTNLDFVVCSMQPDGSLPLSYLAADGTPKLKDGSTQIGWAAALAVTSRLLPDDRRGREYLEAAVKIGDHYAALAAKNLFYGGVPDAGKAVNVEDPYLHMMAHAALYEATREERWLKHWRHAADFFCTWLFTYDVEFPAHTPLAEFKLSSFGLPINSVCNTFLCMWPIIGTQYLYELSALTGDWYYAARASEFFVQSCQMVERGDGKVSKMPGGQPEQWYITNQNNLGQRRDSFTKGDFWVDSVSYPRFCALASYAHVMRRFGNVTVDPKTKAVVALENVEVTGAKFAAGKISLRLRNPNEFPLDLRVVSLGPSETTKTLHLSAGQEEEVQLVLNR